MIHFIDYNLSHMYHMYMHAVHMYGSKNLYVYMYVCMYVFMYVCMHVGKHAGVYI